MFFIITLLTGEIQNKPYKLKKLLHLFSKGNISDKYVEKYRKIYYNKK